MSTESDVWAMSDIFGQLQAELERRQQAFFPFTLTELTPFERKALDLFQHKVHLTRDELSDVLEVDREFVQSMLDRFVEQGALLEYQSESECRYRPLFVRERSNEKSRNIWDAVGKLIR